MTITKNRKRCRSIDIFPNIESFITHLREIYNNINFDNVIINSSITRIYNNLLNDDDNVLYLRLSRWLPKKFGFKHHNKLSLLFWAERGFTEIEYNLYTKVIFKERIVNLKKHIDEVRTYSLTYDKEYSITYRYKTSIFNSDKRPKCNICTYLLSLKKSTMFKEPIYIIKGCENIYCVSNYTTKKDIKWKSYLPKDKYDKIKLKLKSVKRSFSKDFWIQKGYNEEESIKKVFDIQSSNSKKFKGKRIGKDKENLREKGYTVEEIKEISLTPANIKFWIKKGLSEEEAMVIITKNQIHASKFVDYEKRLLPSNIEYWINKGFNVEESKMKVSKSQTTFSRQICIEKYGELVGTRKFNERTQKWQDSLLKNGNIKGGYSKISQELFFNISKLLNGNYKFALNNSELVIRDNNKNYYYDFVDLLNKRIIEYNGDQYHANPNKYTEDEYPHPYKKCIGFTSKDIWKYDAYKILIANNNGYDVLVIWDSEYKKNKQEITQKCINFLTNKPANKYENDI